MTLSFDDYEIDVERRELRRAKIPVHVEPQVFDLLTYLVENRDRVVTKDDLIASVWGGRIVSDSTLTAASMPHERRGRQRCGPEADTHDRERIRVVGDVRTQANATNRHKPPAHRRMKSQARPALPPPDRPAIAVLPFTNMSGDPEQEYFSDGISEDMITALSKLRWFFVIARNSSFIYKGKAVHMKQLAEELGVSYVVEGSVRKSGDHLRISAQLNDVATGATFGPSTTTEACRHVRGAGRDHRGDRCGDRAATLCRGKFSCQAKSPDSMDAWDLVMRALSITGG